MSANHARRHQSGRNQVPNLARRRTEKVLGLLALRERLARAAAEYEAHDLDEALDICQQQLDIEAAIRDLAPDIHDARWTEWVERDVQLAHTPDKPHPECGYCQIVVQRQQHLPWPPAQAS